MHEFWDSSSKIALLTGYLARELGCAKLDEAHTFALFRDCGIPVILARHPEYEQLLATTRNENEDRRSEMEQSQFGFDHARVGAKLAQTWHLPSETCEAIRVHSSYTEPAFGGDPSNIRFAPLIALGLLAEQLHRVHRGTFEADAWETEEAFIAQALGPVQDRLEPLADDIARILEQS
jgi:HD-like signal output (HDOD) protein